MSITERLDVLDKLYDLMEGQSVYNPLNIAEDVDGNEVAHDSPDAVRWCMIGGLWSITGYPDFDADSVEALLREQPAHGVSFTETLGHGNALLNIQQAIDSLREDV